MADRNEILIRLKADVRQLKQDMAEVRGVVSNASEGVRSSAGGMARAFSAAAGKAALALAAVLTLRGAINALKASVQTAAEFEALEVRLQSLYQDAGRGTEVFTRLREVAATTPFELKDIVQAGATLKAFGADAEGLTKSIADLAAFMGTNATEAAAAFGRAFAGGAGAADVLREKGILQLVKSFKGVEDLTKLTLPEFRQALIESVQDPAAGIAGATDRLSATFLGAFSNMKDAITQFAAAVGDTLLPKITSAVRTTTNVINDLRTSFQRLFGTDEASQLRIQQEELTKLASTYFRLREEQTGAASEQKVLAGLRRQMVEMAPAHLENLDLERASWDQISTAVDEANRSLGEQIRVITLKERLTDIDRQRLAIEEQQRDVLTQQMKDTRQLESLSRDYRLNQSILIEQWKADVVAALDAVGRKGNLTADATVAELQRAIVQSTQAVRLENQQLSGAVEENQQRLNELNAEYERLLGYMPDVTEELEGAGKAVRKQPTAWELVKSELEWLHRQDAKGYSAPIESMNDAMAAGVPTYRQFLATQRARLEAQQLEEANLARLIDEYPRLADALGLTTKPAKEMQEEFARVSATVSSVAGELGEGLAAAFAGTEDSLRGMLGRMLLSVLDALKMELLAAKISSTAKGILSGGLSLLKDLPALLAAEAAFAALKAMVVKNFAEGGPIPGGTIAVINERTSRSGQEVVMGDKTFARWANERLLPAVRQDSSASREMRAMRDDITALRLAFQPRTLGREVGRGIVEAAGDAL